MFMEVGDYTPDDAAQWLVRVQLSTGQTVFGWVAHTDNDTVSLTTTRSRQGHPDDYSLHVNPGHIVSWRYADLEEIPR